MRQSKSKSRLNKILVVSPRFAVARAVAEVLENRTLLSITPTAPAGTISGVLWEDVNADGARGAGEPVLAGRTVYLDQNRNRRRDSGEATVVSAADGSYAFTGLAAGKYYVATDLPVGWQQTSPDLAGVVYPLPLQLNQTSPLPPITTTGSKTPMTISGQVAGAPVNVADASSGPLIGLDRYNADPRFGGADGTGFSVAVLDTGVDVDNPAFGPDSNGDGIADRIVYQYDFVNNDNDASDGNGHGSNVTSIAAGSGAYTGVAPGAGIIALKVLSDSGGGDFGYLERALQWLVANADTYHLAAVNMSLGDSSNWSTSQQLYGISDELAALAAKNVIVVAAAGNEYFQFQTQGVSYPAADPNALAIGAVYDSDVGSLSFANGAKDLATGPDRIASFSQRSTSLLDVFAPGGQITGAGPTGGSTTYSGTSQATPHVAGAAVLAQQLAMQQLGRRLTPAEFRSILQTTGATIVDGDDEVDNVTNTGASFKRLDVDAMADAIYQLGGRLPSGYTLTLSASQGLAGADFGSTRRDPTPGKPDLLTDTGTSTTCRSARCSSAARPAAQTRGPNLRGRSGRSCHRGQRPSPCRTHCRRNRCSPGRRYRTWYRRSRRR